jgi:photosystem II stability/assembly factor-like uncharacterized protein
MKHFIAPFIFFLIISMQGFAQWEWINPLPQGNNLNEFFFKNSSELGFAVGRHGAILKTENLGITWSLGDSVTTSDLLSGCYAGEKGFIVGDNGVILQTTDDSTWNSIESGSHYRFNTVVFADANNGYIGGYKGLMLKTTDAGESWQELNSVTLYSIYSGFFFTPEKGIFVGDSGLIIKTTDAGSSWNQPSSGTDLSLLDVYFPSAMVGYIVGKKGLIIKTTNAGDTWTNISFDPMDDELYSVFFWNDTLGYTAGAYGTILRTENGGTTWEYYPGGTDLTIRSISQFHHTDTLCDSLIICGDYGLISRTDSCDLWDNVTQASSNTFSSVLFTNDLYGIAVGGDPFSDKPFMLQTSGANSAWERMTVDTITHYLTDIYFLDDSIGYISGRKGSIYRTNDVGASWIPLNTNTDQNLYSVHFIEPEMGFACGQNGTIIKTASGDTTWTIINSGTTEHLYSIYFIDAANGGYIVGDEGKILRIKNGGNQITNIPSGTNLPFYDICFPTDSVGFIVGYNGKILKIKRGVSSDILFTIPSGVLTPLNKVFFPCRDTGYIAGEGGVVLKTTDAGETWYRQYPGTSNSLRGLCFINDTVGFAVGAGITVIRTVNGGGEVVLPGIIEREDEELPIKLYPNPGTNFAWIEYHLAESSQVQISIFDLSGRKIRDFINMKIDSGVQKQILDFSGIETGIYFVILQAKNRIYAKKIIIF